MKAVTEETARNIARALNISRFERCGYDAKATAQRNLSGKTHYVEDDTLKFFHARINSARVAHEGLTFAMVESVAEDFENRARSFRFVAFDLFGTVLNDRESKHAKSEKATEEMLAWLESFDVLSHYKAAMSETAARLKRESAAMAKAARAIRA